MEHDPEALQDRLDRYAELVRASPHNLLSRAGLEALEDRHIPECVRFAKRLPQGPRLLDVGSGGGLPGIVIAIVRPDLEVHLLEATTKKARFLTEAAETLGLVVEVHNGRAEEFAGGPLRGAFDLVTARAVAPLQKLVGLCAPFLAPGGQIHAIKGERWEAEVTDATSEMRRVGLRVLVDPTDTPELDPKVVVLGR